MKKALTILGILVLSCIATLASVKYERLYPGYAGNVCEVTPSNPRGFCYKDLPSGGFPFSYLFDQGEITGEGYLEFFSDDFNTGRFIADIAFYFAVFLLMVLLIWKKIFCHRLTAHRQH